MFWNKLSDYNILNVPYGEYEDDYLRENLYGITDIVKVPRSYGNEPSDEEYKEGLKRILDLIILYKPKVFVFPMPGTHCKADLAHTSMTLLKQLLKK